MLASESQSLLSERRKVIILKTNAEDGNQPSITGALHIVCVGECFARPPTDGVRGGSFEKLHFIPRGGAGARIGQSSLFGSGHNVATDARVGGHRSMFGKRVAARL